MEKGMFIKNGELVNPFITEDMRVVIVRIQKIKINPDLISPNFVADIAYGMKRNLTSHQIVYISNKFI
tara:strand:+ start:683 stop:886 length:204 start_codon:yes stop_codon:yes gene_type:complete